MSIPILESLEQAPEFGDAILQLTPAYDPDVKPTWCIPVRDRLPSWKIRSVAGWDTTAEIPPALRFEIPTGVGQFMPDPRLWDLQSIVFAPTAEAAIERYHASEACPWGALTLRKPSRWINFSKQEKFFNSENTFWIDILSFTPAFLSILNKGWNDKESTALHALLSEVIAYQTAERFSSRDSRIHKALEMERAK